MGRLHGFRDDAAHFGRNRSLSRIFLGEKQTAEEQEGRRRSGIGTLLSERVSHGQREDEHDSRGLVHACQVRISRQSCLMPRQMRPCTVGDDVFVCRREIRNCFPYLDLDDVNLIVACDRFKVFALVLSYRFKVEVDPYFNPINAVRTGTN